MFFSSSEFNNFQDCTNFQFEYLKYLEDNKVHENIMRVLNDIRIKEIPTENQLNYATCYIVPLTEEEVQEEEAISRENDDLRIKIESMKNSLKWMEEDSKNEVFDCKLTHSIPKIKVKLFDMENINFEHEEFIESKKVTEISINLTPETIEITSSKKSYNLTGVIQTPRPSLLSKEPILFKYNLSDGGSFCYLLLSVSENGIVSLKEMMMFLKDSLKGQSQRGGSKSTRKTSRKKIGSILKFMVIGEKRRIGEEINNEEEEKMEVKKSGRKIKGKSSRRKGKKKN